MTRDVVTVPPSMRLPRAWQLMRELGVRHLPVVQQGSLVGILSDRDVLLRARPADDTGGARDAELALIVDDVIVGIAMTSAPTTCHADAPVSALARAMIDDKIDALPVMREGRLAGLVTSTDLMWLLLSDEARPLQLAFTVRAASEQGRLAS